MEVTSKGRKEKNTPRTRKRHRQASDAKWRANMLLCYSILQHAKIQPKTEGAAQSLKCARTTSLKKALEQMRKQQCSLSKLIAGSNVKEAMDESLHAFQNEFRQYILLTDRSMGKKVESSREVCHRQPIVKFDPPSSTIVDPTMISIARLVTPDDLATVSPDDLNFVHSFHTDWEEYQAVPDVQSVNDPSINPNRLTQDCNAESVNPNHLTQDYNAESYRASCSSVPLNDTAEKRLILNPDVHPDLHPDLSPSLAISPPSLSLSPPSLSLSPSCSWLESVSVCGGSGSSNSGSANSRSTEQTTPNRFSVSWTNEAFSSPPIEMPPCARLLFSSHPESPSRPDSSSHLEILCRPESLSTQAKIVPSQYQNMFYRDMNDVVDILSDEACLPQNQRPLEFSNRLDIDAVSRPELIQTVPSHSFMMEAFDLSQDSEYSLSPVTQRAHQDLVEKCSDEPMKAMKCRSDPLISSVNSAFRAFTSIKTGNSYTPTVGSPWNPDDSTANIIDWE